MITSDQDEADRSAGEGVESRRRGWGRISCRVILGLPVSGRVRVRLSVRVRVRVRKLCYKQEQ